MHLTVKALVLRVTDYNDRDALLTILSPNHGKLTVKARGLVCCSLWSQKEPDMT